MPIVFSAKRYFKVVKDRGQPRYNITKQHWSIFSILVLLQHEYLLC